MNEETSVEWVEPDASGPVIDLTQGPDACTVIDATPDDAEVVIDASPVVTEVVIDARGNVIDPKESLECDLCGQPAMVVVQDKENTTLCDDCYDGYFREQPVWSVTEYLERQGRV